MKYLSKLNDEQLTELLKIFTGDGFKDTVSIKRYDSEIEATVNVNIEDDGDGEIIELEDTYTFTDYDVRIWDYQCSNKADLIRSYRSKMLEWFGNQYALDYLLN